MELRQIKKSSSRANNGEKIRVQSCRSTIFSFTIFWSQPSRLVLIEIKQRNSSTQPKAITIPHSIHFLGMQTVTREIFASHTFSFADDGSRPTALSILFFSSCVNRREATHIRGYVCSRVYANAIVGMYVFMQM